LNTYECMYIIQTSLSDEESEKANGRMVEEIEKRGGSMLHRDRFGKKRLAYSIGKFDDGVYYLMYFELPANEISSLRQAYKMHNRLIRFLILRKEREDVPKPQKRTPPPAEAAGAPAQQPEGKQQVQEAVATGEAAATGEAVATGETAAAGEAVATGETSEDVATGEAAATSEDVATGEAAATSEDVAQEPAAEEAPEAPPAEVDADEAPAEAEAQAETDPETDPAKQE